MFLFCFLLSIHNEEIDFKGVLCIITLLCCFNFHLFLSVFYLIHTVLIVFILHFTYYSVFNLCLKYSVEKAPWAVFLVEKVLWKLSSLLLILLLLLSVTVVEFSSQLPLGLLPFGNAQITFNRSPWLKRGSAGKWRALFSGSQQSTWSSKIKQCNTWLDR